MPGRKEESGDCEVISCVCTNSPESFENTMKEILASDEILNVIQMLFSKAAMISGRLFVNVCEWKKIWKCRRKSDKI